MNKKPSEVIMHVLMFFIAEGGGGGEVGGWLAGGERGGR